MESTAFQIVVARVGHLIRCLKPFLAPLDGLLRFLKMAFAGAPPVEQERSRLPWDPPFDPSKPSRPISYPITTLRDLESRSYFGSFHFPFNRTAVPLPHSAVDLPPRRRLLVCHDMKGGYVDDVWVQGGDNPDAYAIWHWHLMDVFVYFSHYLVTLPPPCWTNAAHTHGVKVLGTFITEWDEGRIICNTLLQTKESAQMFAERLAELATALGFDGWLINIEVNLDLKQVDNLKEFVHHLSQTMHDSVPGSLVIWYDAVTIDGILDWQDRLNEKNKPFFDLCDGIFVNYTWKVNYPEMSADTAGDRRFDVYMGIDVFGRNTFGGGQWNTNVALDVLKKDDVSAAIFAPGWVYETDQKPDFQTAQNRWWSLVEQSWGILQKYPKTLPFYSDFDQGHGYHFSVEGMKVTDDPWNNISSQGFQSVFSSPDNSASSIQVFTNFMDASYGGGGSITIHGTLADNLIFAKKLFDGELTFEDALVHFSYSVRSDEDSLFALCLELRSQTNARISLLFANDFPSFALIEPKYDKIISPEVKEMEMANLALDTWVLYETSMNLSGYTLAGIHVVCMSKRYTSINIKADESRDKEKSLGQFGSSPYHASLGHISIRTVEQDMEFPPASSWVTEGQNISWTSDSDGNRTVSLKIAWKLKAGYTRYFRRYNIYLEKLDVQTDQASSSSNCIYLGFARVEAFFVSNIGISTGATTLRFVIQVCSDDGTCQRLKESPVLEIAVEDM